MVPDTMMHLNRTAIQGNNSRDNEEACESEAQDALVSLLVGRLAHRPSTRGFDHPMSVGRKIV